MHKRSQPTHVVLCGMVQYSNSWPIQYGYNTVLADPCGMSKITPLAGVGCVDWAIIKLGGPCGIGSFTERAANDKS